jgi:hypothetical protein
MTLGRIRDKRQAAVVPRAGHPILRSRNRGVRQPDEAMLCAIPRDWLPVYDILALRVETGIDRSAPGFR